jgi:hypothetical protein
MNVRVWAEYFSPKDALKKNVVRLLKNYGVTLGMAFPPGSMNDDYAKMLAGYEQAGIPVMLWALLPDESGYWACERNAREFSEYVEKIYAWADSNKFGIPWLAVDLEPPFGQMDLVKKSSGLDIVRNLVEVYRQNRDRGRFYSSGEEYSRLVERMHSRGVKVLTAASCQVAEDFVKGAVGIQDAMETPISPVNWDVVSFMMYTSMIAGYLKPFISPADARWYLYSVMSDMKQLLWDRAGVSIGVTYIGKLEDEPYYSTPEELLPDMRATKAALINDVSIYNLEGILRSPRPEAWFETLISCEAAVPERSLKIEAVRLVMQAGSILM